MRERRRQTADDLYDALVTGGYSFWEHIHPIFLSRDITRHDIRELVVRGLRTTHGNYRGLLRLFGIPTHDYKRFHNFLMAHGCKVDYRSFRQGTPEPARRHKRSCRRCGRHQAHRASPIRPRTRPPPTRSPTTDPHGSGASVPTSNFQVPNFQLPSPQRQQPAK